MVDAAAIRFFQGLRSRFGRVWVAPSHAPLSPAVGLEALRYVLGRLKCLEGALRSPGDAPAGVAVVEFPAELLSRSLSAVPGRVPADDRQPDSCSVEEVMDDRPTPLVLVTGCFDLVHAGHVRLIEAAAEHGAHPVVAALTSRAIRDRPKNARRSRPLWSMADRLTVLRELRVGPRVLFFEAPDSLALIERLGPEVWIKAHRDRGRSVVAEEARLVERLGGRVIWRPHDESPTSSTTDIEARMLSLRGR